MGHKKPLPPLEADFVTKVVRLYLAGHSIEKCALELECSFDRARRALVQAEVPLRSIGDSIRANRKVRGVCRQNTARTDFA